ncbi:MAG TPA: hypothetical protein VG126_16205 [Thermoleophilaceae bacterium]|nr:hypothetical protein [Thermoleophilaceae bacterium]
MSHSDDSPDQIGESPSAAGQAEGPAVGGDGEPVATETDPVTSDAGDGQDAPSGGGKGKVAVAAAGTGAAVAGLAGGIVVVARDTRRRVLGVPLGKRSRFQRTASTVVDRAMEPGRRLTSRFSRD